jgi:hypothetical protein
VAVTHLYFASAVIRVDVLDVPGSSREVLHGRNAGRSLRDLLDCHREPMR